MPWTNLLPPDTRSVGSGNPPADMNGAVDALTAMGAGFNVQNPVFAGGADPLGVADSTAAWQAAAAAIPAAGGFMDVPPGTYKISSTIGPLTTNQWIICAPGVIINWTGTGDCLRWTDTSTYTTRTVQGGGILGRPVINGSGDGAGSCALHAGDILGFRFDVAVQNFSKAGDVPVHLDNQNFWTEQAIGTAWINNCTSMMVFDCGGATTSNSSFDRADVTVYVSQLAGQNGVTLQNGASIVGGRLRIFGNVASSSSVLSTAVLTLTGVTPGGHSIITNSGLAQCELDINVECDGGLTYTPVTISYGSTSNAITDCSGNMSFGPGNQFTASNITTITSQFVYLGPVVGDAALAEQIIINRFGVNGSASFFSSVYFAGITGATAGFRLVGATASGAPASGAFLTGDFVVDQAGATWICTAGGSPGTWKLAGGSVDQIVAAHPTAASWSNSFHAISSISSVGITGITGTGACRVVGSIASGTAPASGTFVTGDMIIVLTGSIIICTAGGTVGTWVVA